LVSVALMAYNQERYVRESLRSILNQSYGNLEIIVSDDCSKDGTWRCIESEVDRYRSRRGVHTDIVLNRNRENMGVARHFELILSKCHGELVVCQAGDDVSLPERVQTIVDAFEKNRNATVLSHEAICIDENGNETDSGVMRTSALMPLGALMAYSLRVYREFGPISEKGAWEDDVYARRAQMLGDEVRIDKVLLKYRTGCGGISSGKDAVKARRTRVVTGCLASARQSRKDLEQCRASIGEDRFSKVLKDIDWYEQRYSDEYRMYNAPCWMQKMQAFRRLHKGLRGLSYAYQFSEKMLPGWLSVPISRVAKVGRMIFRR